MLLLLPAACGGPFTRIELEPDQEGARRLARTGDVGAEVEDLVRPLQQRNTTPALVVGVLLPDGSRQTFGYGTTRTKGGHRPDGETLFAIGSSSKGLVSAAAAVLVQEGRLSWHDTMKDLLPEAALFSPDAQKITLLELATHTSGLPRHPFTPRFLVYFTEFLFTGNNFYRYLDRDYLLDYLAGFKAPEHPGVRYSNIGYGLLGHTLERVTGKELATLINDKVLLPLGMQATGYDPAQLPGYHQRAFPHAGDHPKFIRRGRPVPEWEFTDILHGAAGLYTNAYDLLSYAAAHLHPPRQPVLARALQDTLEVRVKDSDQDDRALAWAISQVDDLTITYQVGYVSGYSSYIGLDRENLTAVVVLQNSLNWQESIGHRLLLRLGQAAEGNFKITWELDGGRHQ
ncbi:serine hydrolase domain-containing protein [Desulfurivibrio alkaliphilus]|uniref:Beta-lactamase n=1 Tax=Desulfurivibrio alkaliphilus (strain DSM 19089 / UNIQEM U267 / AHT2) TaxID=589865 RepID=D6Z2M7_DESAT|nr:serine hydrolase domain-containing protein [Desulfurivibrio alkaliphilus]ADH85802.1 beta-lactamase [Desulfurivibrio alkaliphilus AHT 2]